ncbi:MAG: hypothetical protein J6T94_05520 [Bacteroidaceae bacterium]|nr:hypothetical protein [Bacteroidaceae bacterium]
MPPATYGLHVTLALLYTESTDRRWSSLIHSTFSTLPPPYRPFRSYTHSVPPRWIRRRASG